MLPMLLQRYIIRWVTFFQLLALHYQSVANGVPGTLASVPAVAAIRAAAGVVRERAERPPSLNVVVLLPKVLTASCKGVTPASVARVGASFLDGAFEPLTSF